MKALNVEKRKMGKSVEIRTLGVIFPNYRNVLATLKQLKLHPRMAFRYEWDLRMQNVELKILVPCKVSWPWFWVLGLFFHKSYPNERKPSNKRTEPSDRFLHLRKTLFDMRWKVEQVRLFFVFLVADLVI